MERRSAEYDRSTTEPSKRNSNRCYLNLSTELRFKSSVPMRGLQLPGSGRSSQKILHALSRTLSIHANNTWNITMNSQGGPQFQGGTFSGTTFSWGKQNVRMLSGLCRNWFWASRSLSKKGKGTNQPRSGIAQAAPQHEITHLTTSNLLITSLHNSRGTMQSPLFDLH